MEIYKYWIKILTGSKTEGLPLGEVSNELKRAILNCPGRYLGPRRTKQSEGRVAEHHPSQLQPASTISRIGKDWSLGMVDDANSNRKTTVQYNLEKIRFLNPSWSFTWRDAKRKDMKKHVQWFRGKKHFIANCMLFLSSLPRLRKLTCLYSCSYRMTQSNWCSVELAQEPASQFTILKAIELH